jgi:hypothetical protein
LCGLVRNLGTLEKTSILSTRITENAFYELHRQKDASALVQITSTATPDPNEYVPLSVGTIHAVRTASGKHGLILVKDISFSAITIDACHILL